MGLKLWASVAVAACLQEWVVSPAGHEISPTATTVESGGVDAGGGGGEGTVGVLRSYSWKFVTTSGAIADSGTTACHGSGAAPAAVAAAHVTRMARAASLSGPRLAFDVHPLRVSLHSMTHTGIPVSVYCSRACDVAVTISLRRSGQLRRIATAYETESQIPRPYSRILLRVPARWLKHPAGGALVMRFAAVDAAGHRRTLMRTMELR